MFWIIHAVNWTRFSLTTTIDVIVKTLKERNGTDWADGATGPTGPQGATGATGPQGPTGTTGSVWNFISKTAHSAGASDRHFGLYSPNSGSANNEFPLRFPQGGIYWGQIRFRSSQFYFTRDLVIVGTQSIQER